MRERNDWLDRGLRYKRQGCINGIWQAMNGRAGGRTGVVVKRQAGRKAVGNWCVGKKKRGGGGGGRKGKQKKEVEPWNPRLRPNRRACAWLLRIGWTQRPQTTLASPFQRGRCSLGVAVLLVLGLWRRFCNYLIRWPLPNIQYDTIRSTITGHYRMYSV